MADQPSHHAPHGSHTWAYDEHHVLRCSGCGLERDAFDTQRADDDVPTVGFGDPVSVTLGWLEDGVVVTIKDEDGARIGRLWLDRPTLAEILASKADQPAKWEVPGG